MTACIYYIYALTPWQNVYGSYNLSIVCFAPKRVDTHTAIHFMYDRKYDQFLSAVMSTTYHSILIRFRLDLVDILLRLGDIVYTICPVLSLCVR